MAVPVLQGSDHQTITFGSSQTKNVSLTVHAACDFLIVKHAAYQGVAGDEGITGMTWNSVSLTRAVTSNAPFTDEWASIWYLAAPTTGAHTLAITYNSVGNPYGSDVIAEYWSGVSASIGDTDGHFTQGAGITSDSLSITTTTDGMTTALIYVNVVTAITPGAGSTTVFEGNDVGLAERICAYYKSGEPAPSATFAGSARIAHVAMELKAGGGGGSPPTLSSMTPSSGFANATVDVTFVGIAIVGTNLNGASPTVNVPGGWTVTNLNVASGLNATFDMTIPAGTASGSNNISYSTTDGTSGALTFTVSSATPGTSVGGGNQRGGFIN